MSLSDKRCRLITACGGVIYRNQPFIFNKFN